jgi:hypothetical protein
LLRFLGGRFALPRDAAMTIGENFAYFAAVRAFA